MPQQKRSYTHEELLEIGAVPGSVHRDYQTEPTTIPISEKVAQFLKGFGSGIGKGAISTGLGISRTLGAVPQETTIEDLGFQTPEGTAEKAGFAVEQIGEFFLPGASVGRLPKVAGLMAKTGKGGLAARIAFEGAGAGGVSLAQTEDPRAALLDAAIDSAFTAVFGVLSKPLKRIGEKSMLAGINPADTDIHQGFKVSNIFKHHLQGGSLGVMSKKANAKMSVLSNQLRDAITKHGDVQVDLVDLLTDAANEIRSKGTRFAFQIADLPNAESRLLNAINAISPSGKVGLLDAQGMKQAVGEMGAFAENNPAIELRSLELLANTYYQKLRKAVETGAPEVKNINEQLSEIIPINDALIRKLPAAEKKRLFELGELIVLSGGTEALMGGASLGRVGTGTAGLLLLSRVMRSPRAGQAIHKAGAIAPATGRVLGRTSAGLTDSQVQILERTRQ